MKEKILIVDDNKDTLEIISLILTDSGYEIKCQTHGNRIFEVINEFQPDLLLMDIMLGLTDGMAICQEIKNNNQYDHLPVIIISGTYDLESSLDLPGAPNDYLAKPFDIEALLNKVKKHLKAN